MKKIILIIAIISCFGSAFSQWETTTLTASFSSSKFAKAITVKPYFKGGYGSNVVSHNFIKKIICGGYIDVAEKDKIDQHIKKEGIFGYTMRYGVDLKFDLSPSHAVSLNLEDRYVASYMFSKSAFQTAAYGNAYSDTINLGNNYLHQIHLQKISLSYEYTKQWNQFLFNLGATVSFLAGINHYYFESEAAQLTTDVYGQCLGLTGRFAYQGVDKPTYYKGYGVGGDLRFRLVYNCSSKGQKASYVALTVAAEDFGRMAWPQSRRLLQQDYAIDYDGLNISGLALTGLSLKDTLTNLVTDSLSKSYKDSYTPSSLSVKLTYERETGISKGLYAYGFQAAVQTYFFSKIKPYTELEPFLVCRFEQSDYLRIGLPISYGGYGGFGLGVNCFYQTAALALKNHRYSQMKVNIGLQINQIGLNRAGLYGALYCILKFYKS